MSKEQPLNGTITVRHGAYLPHWTREGAIYAVTFRLADSLPRVVLDSWELEREDIIKTARRMKRPLTHAEEKRLDVLFSEKVEKYLDAGAGECWMQRNDVASLVAGALQHFDAPWHGRPARDVAGGSHGRPARESVRCSTAVSPVGSHGQDGHATRHGPPAREQARYRLFAWCVMPNHVHTVVQPLPGYELPQIVHSWKSFTAKEANRLIGRTGHFWQPEPYDHLIRDEDDFERQVQYVLTNPIRAGLKDWKWVGPDVSDVARASRP